MVILLYFSDEYDINMAICCSSMMSGIEASYYGSMLMSCCDCTVVFLSIYVHEFYQVVVASIIGYCILLPYAVGQDLI